MLAYALARIKDWEDQDLRFRCLGPLHRLIEVCQDPSMLQALLDKSLAKIDDFGPTDAAKPMGCRSLLANLGPG